ncbi:AAA family ATPase [Sandaracinus amylolyticus]|uniref:MoxR-like ATPase n=1 Tax=Sandaracinus amylolyticus TaxID=927083 RepID=A0A0F6SFU1_9BACT|nr:AAA family ATPase [Sandaracinus amylolyticus]AKF07534.1 MoxR-like ATPase [Sandaracinus amylolyticus]
MDATTSSSENLPSTNGSGGLESAHEVASRLKARLGAVVRGREDVIELVLTALLADGHVLLEDYPGSGKTTLARALGGSIREDQGVVGIAPFRRIQFTPDLLPSDITGTNVFELERSNFVFRRGPIFAHVVLADEINRTSPKVQAAMLEAMAEKQVTVDNDTHALDDLFFVIATQNPLDLAGTYPLPTPQLDRFLFKIKMEHISRDAELEVLAAYPAPHLSLADEVPGVTRHDLLAARRALRANVALDAAFREALVDLARSLRDDKRVLQGASTRSLVLMMPALQARALVAGRDHVTPHDLEVLAPYVFTHRLECAPGVDDAASVVREHAKAQVEKLARRSLKR